MSNFKPKKEIKINKEIVKRLIDEQFSNCSDLDINYLCSGWDNENYLLGSDYVVRLPRRMSSTRLILNEIRCLNLLKDSLSINTPFPILEGKPSDEYSEKWVIYPFFEGNTVINSDLNNSQAECFAMFLKELHSFSIVNAPNNPYRSIPLREKSDLVEKGFKVLFENKLFDIKKIERIWNKAVLLNLDKKCLIHGDLHSKNIIEKNGNIIAVIDWGDITLGDPATDLACLWMLFEKDSRQIIFNNYGIDNSLFYRSMGWAIFFGVVFYFSGIQGEKDNMYISEKIFSAISNEDV
ncbi:MAG: phosphotransferase [Bacteroidales bacterium]